jgi:hypothetical protein
VFKKVLIANRGEIALRVIRACRELGVETVAVYSEADRESLHVRFADDDVCIGPPPSRLSYLKIPGLIAAAEITGADAIHPGYGFLAESAEFAEACRNSNIAFIGPTPEQIRLMGDKAAARKLAKALKIPVVPGSPGAVAEPAEAEGLSREIGFPVIIKAAAGGGGKGMRVAADAESFAQAFQLARNEALAALAATVYLSVMGRQGLREVGRLCLQKAHYLKHRLCEIKGFETAFQRPFFKEFVVKTPAPPARLNKRLFRHKIIGGLDLGGVSRKWKNHWLVCVTEKRTKDEMDQFVNILKQTVS